MSWIKVEPYKRPRLSKSGLLTIMSPGGRGLACVATTCPAPGCDCRDILFQVIPIDFQVKKVSRNEPCPCGSGKKYKKYKKCCLPGAT